MDKREIDLDYTEISSTDKSILIHQDYTGDPSLDKTQIYKDLQELQFLNQEILEENQKLIQKNQSLAKQIGKVV